MKQNIDTPAFPSSGEKGLTKLEYALIHSGWEPSKGDVDAVVHRQRALNPHNDSHKPKLQSYAEIVRDLKIKHFTTLLNINNNE